MRLLIQPKVMMEKTLALASGHTFLLSTNCLSANTCSHNGKADFCNGKADFWNHSRQSRVPGDILQPERTRHFAINSVNSIAHFKAQSHK